MDTTINDRVRALVHDRRLVQKALADQVGMTADALSRALSGQRGFGSLELARIADALNVDVYELITGEPDPNRLLVAARHSYDHDTGTYSNNTAEEDRPLLADIRLAYTQAYPGGQPPASQVPSSPEAVREVLGADFVRHLADRLEEHCGVDVVRIPKLGTAYSMFMGTRALIVIASNGNWFRENWDIAHELGHLAAGTVGDGARVEAAANNFAARLLLPEDMILQVDWTSLTLEALGEHLWQWGVSTDALRIRLGSLGVRTSSEVDGWLRASTPQLLRNALPAHISEMIERQREAAARRFPTALTDEHEKAIADGRLGKGTLAWMLGVSEDALEVAEPELRHGSVDGLADMLGLVPT